MLSLFRYSLRTRLARLNDASSRKENALNIDRWAQNLPKALRVLRQLKQEGRFREGMNLFGWSYQSKKLGSLVRWKLLSVAIDST